MQVFPLSAHAQQEAEGRDAEPDNRAALAVGCLGDRRREACMTTIHPAEGWQTGNRSALTARLRVSPLLGLPR
jgi:hypothetical protein